MVAKRSGIEAKDCVVLFADLQSGIVELSKTNPLRTLQGKVLGLAKLAKLFGMPVVITGVRGEGGGAAGMLRQIAEGCGENDVHYRSTCDALKNDAIAQALRKTGRKTLLVSGVATELAVQLAALSAADEGYRVYVVLDACGGMSDRTEQAALLRMTSAGVTTTSVMTLAGEVAGDFSEPNGMKAVGIVYEMAQLA